METPLVTSLVVSGLGMLLLFLALVFLYGLMRLMTAATGDRSSAPVAPAGDERSEAAGGEARLRAAAIAVALARAERELSPIGASPAAVDELTSSWWAFHHQRRLTSNLNIRRTRGEPDEAIPHNP